MSTDAAARLGPIGPFEQLRYAREIVQLESKAIAEVAGRIDLRFSDVVQAIYECRGSVIVTGIGKAGLIGQKISATFSSTGARSSFLHPAEAVHGDLGRIHADDVLLVLSQSGETEEILRILPSLTAMNVPILAITGRAASSLGRAAAAVVELGHLREACPLDLAPSTSTTAMLAVGDAIALVVSRMRSFGRADFARVHPAGQLGRRLRKVEELMRPLSECRVAREAQSVRDVFVAVSRPGRRSGAIMLIDGDGRLAGIFTDSDLARLFETRRDADLDRAIATVMTPRPATVPIGSMLTDAMAIMAERKISELPVVDSANVPAGMIDITDVVGLLPEQNLPGPHVRFSPLPARPTAESAP